MDVASVPFASMLDAMLPDLPQALRAAILSHCVPRGILDMVYNSSAPHKLAVKVDATVPADSSLRIALNKFAPSLSGKVFSMTFEADTGAGRRLGTSVSRDESRIQLAVVDDEPVEIISKVMEARNIVITADLTLGGVVLGVNATVSMLSLSDRGPVSFSASGTYAFDSETWNIRARAMADVQAAFGFSSLALSGMEADLALGAGP